MGMDEAFKILEEVLELKFSSIQDLQKALTNLDSLSTTHKDEAILGCAYIMAKLGQVNLPLLMLRLVDSQTVEKLPSLKKLLQDAGVEVVANEKDNTGTKVVSIELD